ncbi:beta strand repeat-containing protein [Spirosoma gilvum]
MKLLTKFFYFAYRVRAVAPIGIALFLAVNFLTFSPTYGQTKRYVKPIASGTGTGDSWLNASSDLQAMITASASGDQVWVATGTYKPNGDANTDRTKSFSLKNGVIVYGGFMGSESTLGDRPSVNPITGNPSSTTLSGEIGDPTSTTDNSYHVIYNTSGLNLTSSTTLDGFVITGGRADGSSLNNLGGGLLNNSNSPTLTNCLFVANWGGNGGGAANSTNSSPIVTNCSFQSNTSTSGGGLFNTSSSNPTLTGCFFLTNSATGSGGGMTNTSNCTPELQNCTFQSNSASVGGGAMYNTTSCKPTLTGCTLLSNSASANGGAINTESGSDFQMVNCLLKNNSSSANGGVLEVNNSTPTLTNCSFLGNSASSNGGVVHTSSGNARLINCSFQSNTSINGRVIHNNNGNVVLTNCVLFDNGGNKTIFHFGTGGVSASYSLFEPTSVTVSGFTSVTGNLTTTVSPFASTTSTELSACAPAINTGDPASATVASGPYSVSALPSTDLAGNSRIFGNLVDMGAYEFQGTASLQTAFTTLPVAGSSVCSGGTVTASISVSGTGPFTYAWYKGAGLVSPAQSTSALSLTNVQTGDAGSYSIVVTGACNSVTSTAFSLTVNASPVASLTASNSGTLTCSLASLTLTASGGTSFTFANSSGTLGTPGTSQTLVVTTPDTYSVTVSNANGCRVTVATSVSLTNTLAVSAGSALPLADIGVTVSLSASGATTYQWTAPTGTSFTTPSTSSAVSASLLTSGVKTFTLVASSGACSQTKLVSVTVVTGPDLTSILSLPDANFPANGSKQLLIQVQEVNGFATTGSSITINITVPAGYTISYDNTLTSINVSGGSNNPVAVQNSKWQVSSNVANQQLSLTINGGESMGANTTLNLGFTITRTTANSGSTSNITINVADDSGGSYDNNHLNNIFARIISGL